MLEIEIILLDVLIVAKDKNVIFARKKK